MEELAECLPEALRGQPITRISSGLSGAGVFRVGDRHVLKISPRFAMTKLASDAGVGATVVHVDEARQAVVTELVADHGFVPILLRDRAAAIALLGTALRRVHDVPAPSGAPPDRRGFLAGVHAQLAGMALPAFASDAIEAALAANAPPRGPLGLSHGDANPTNLVFDGERIVFLDWDTADPDDAMWDVATVAMFLRMDRPACLALLSAHDGVAVTELSPRFVYCRRMSAAMCGALFLTLARRDGHPGDPTAAAPDPRPGPPDVASPAGKWAYGLTLLQRSATAIAP